VARFSSSLTLNQKLGLAALSLGLLAVFANVEPPRTTRVNEKELLTSVARKEDHVTPQELAAWIVEGRADYRLVDIREPGAYAQYHIPTAENVPLATVADGALGRTQNIVLYGDGGIHAAQAWMVLKGRGYTSVHTLLEGLDAWKSDVLFPEQPKNPSPDEAARFERTVALARFFGGQPRAAASGGELAPTASLATPPLPSVTPPTLPGGVPPMTPRKKKEGC
jgi:rhodanese-related sulfurtransferase